MKTNLLKSMAALVAMFGLGTMNVAAEDDNTAVVPVKMTYVSGSDADVDVAYGECDTIKAGWNHGNAVAIGSTINLGNKGWGANWIGVLKFDASAVPGTIQKATLKAKVSGALDSKRNTGWFVAKTDNEWSAELTYTTVSTWTVSALLNGGEAVWTSSKSSTGFEEKEWDVTDAFAGGQTNATILVYEGIKDGNGGAAGGFMTEAVVEVEYDPFEATTKTYDFDGDAPVNPFTDDSRIAGGIITDDVLHSNVLEWVCANNAGNGYSFAHFDFTKLLNTPALVKVEFDYYNAKGGRAILNIGDALVRGTTGGHEGKLFGGGSGYVFKGTIFRIGSDKENAYINEFVLPQDDKVTTSTVMVKDEETGEETEVNVESTEFGLCDRWLHVVAIVNNDTKTVTWVVTNQNEELIHTGSSAFYSDDANECTQIDLIAGINNSHCAMIDNLEITNYKSNAQFADYSVKFVDAAGNELKEARTANGQVGKNVTLLPADKEAIRTADKKYIYDSDDSETVAIAESGTEITVKFREAETYGAVLNCMIDGQTGADARLASLQGTFFEGDNYYIRPARGYAKDGKYYFVEADSYNGKVFSFPGSLNSRTVNGVVTYIGQLNYTLDEAVAYYSDIERLALPVEDEGYGTGLGQLVGSVAEPTAKGPQEPWFSFSGDYFDRFSQGRGVRMSSGSYVYTEPIAEDATYMVRIYGRNDKNSNCEKPYALGIRDAEGNVELFDVAVPTWASSDTNQSVIGNAAVEAQEATETSEAVEAKDATGIGIKAGYSLVIMNTGDGTNISLDDVKLTKVAAYAETPTVGIASVEQRVQNNGIIYNLNGQVVKNAQKGIFIQNGKKVVLK